MITKEMLKDSSSKAKYRAKVGQPLKIVLDPAEVQFALSSGKTSVSVIQFTIDERRYFFYTDDYVNGKGITWGPGKLSTIETVPSTTQMPHKVTPRQGLEAGWVSNLREFEFVYHQGDHRISSVEEYLDILNNNLVYQGLGMKCRGITMAPRVLGEIHEVDGAKEIRNIEILSFDIVNK